MHLADAFPDAGFIAAAYGRRFTLYSGMIVFAISSLLAGYSSTIQTLIFWRLIQGIACAILYTASGAIISSIFPPEKLGRAMGLFFGISFTGLAAGPVLGGLIVDRKGPQKPLLWGFILFTISALLQVSFSSTTSIFVIIIAFIIMGIAWGAVVGPSTIMAMSALPASNQGVAIGMSWTLHNIGGAIGLSLDVLIYHLQLEKYADSFIAGYHGAMSLLIFSSLLCYLILSYCFKKLI